MLVESGAYVKKPLSLWMHDLWQHEQLLLKLAMSPASGRNQAMGLGIVLAGSASGWLWFELQRVKFERSPQIPIIGSNGFGFLHVDLERLEQGPVLDVVPVL